MSNWKENALDALHRSLYPVPQELNEIDWKDDEKKRLNPCNGLAMNVLFHRAYDKMFIGITPDLRVEVSDRMYDGLRGDDKDKTHTFFNPYNGVQITLPRKFNPNLAFLEEHYARFKNAK